MRTDIFLLTLIISCCKTTKLFSLVAGIAYEINNLVNFIHGNLSHLQEYTENLLNFLHLYQKYYPNPVTEIETQAEAIELSF